MTETRRSALPPWQIQNLQQVCAIDEAKLVECAAALRSADTIIERDAIVSLMRKYVGEDASALQTFVFGLNANYRSDASNSSQVLSFIDRTMASEDPASELSQAWAARRHCLTEMVESTAVRLTVKALDIAYDFERLYIGGRFLTSFRPVFNDTRNEIQGGTIVHTLRLSYVGSDGEEETISVSMDANDIENLQEACTQALRKSELLVEKVRVGLGVPTLVAGKEASK